jgi:hypothetical protein
MTVLYRWSLLLPRSISRTIAWCGLFSSSFNRLSMTRQLNSSIICSVYCNTFHST